MYCYPSVITGGSWIVNRDKHAHTRPITNARLSQWIKSNTAPDEVILSWRSSPVAPSGRYLPTGMEQGFGVAELFWHRLSDEQARRYNIVPGNKIEKMLSETKINIVIDDPYSSNVIKYGFTRYHSLLEKKYKFLGSYAHYRVYVNPEWELSHPLTPLPRADKTAAKSFLDDLNDSLIRLLGLDSS
jgi:hypothetical protein